MSEELKLCPYCGGTAYKVQAKRIMHSCNAINVGMSREHWQSRPIEDALRKQLEVAEYAMMRANLVVPMTDIGIRNFHILDDALTEIHRIGGMNE